MFPTWMTARRSRERRRGVGRHVLPVGGPSSSLGVTRESRTFTTGLRRPHQTRTEGDVRSPSVPQSYSTTGRVRGTRVHQEIPSGPTSQGSDRVSVDPFRVDSKFSRTRHPPGQTPRTLSGKGCRPRIRTLGEREGPRVNPGETGREDNLRRRTKGDGLG